MTVATIVVAVLALRLVGLETAYDTFVDEFFYASMGVSVAAGHLPPMSGGEPFLLHPPGFFIVEAIWSQAVPGTADLVSVVHAVRVLQQLLAAGSAVLLFLVVDRVAGRWPAVVAAGLFATDAYLLRQNARVLLETTTLTFVLAGILALVHLAFGRGDRGLAVVCGFSFGAAILTKDMAVVVTVLPLLVIALTNWCGLRSHAVFAAGTAVACYAAYVVFLLFTGHSAALWAAKGSGLERILGLSVVTGFNAPQSPALSSVVWSQMFDFTPSYLVLAAGAAGAVWLLARPGGPVDRTIAIFYVAAAALMAYELAFGTIEEHFLYFLMIPALLSATVAGARLWSHSPRPRRAVRAMLAGLVVILALNLGTWGRMHASADDGHQQAMRWLAANAGEGTRVAWVAGQTELALRDSSLVAVPLGSPADMAVQQVVYLVTLEKTVAQGYSFATPESIDWYARHATKIFSFEGRSYGEVAIYRTIDRNLW